MARFRLETEHGVAFAEEEQCQTCPQSPLGEVFPATGQPGGAWRSVDGFATGPRWEQIAEDMAKAYKLSTGTRLINWVFGAMTRLGISASYRHIPTVAGRKTGKLHSTPVDVLEAGGDRWLVAGYGASNCVRNARAVGEVTLTRGGHARRYKIAEVPLA